MRFLADGPSIPDELLEARDQGRVVFFCGAGVSRARAKLPDFFGLAEKVVERLRVAKDSPAYRLIQEAREIDKRVGVSGVISADRVFGLLERDFDSKDIEEAVAGALKPPPACDLSAHNMLLDLATAPDGTIRLVTTNFDRLFDDCGRGLSIWQSPRLPDPQRPREMNGIVYLHGRATENYDGAEGDGFTLSSSEFGRAYLSDGWGVDFIREVLLRYIVVFVGYTADDPPVQYLLEALRKTSGRIEGAYAFQSGEHEDAAARWRHKGVDAIPYEADREHSALWQSLEKWAERARDPQGWRTQVINRARGGPEDLQPHERGQVAHIVSTYEGAKSFTEGDNPPPAEWLCCFDPHRRFAKPGHIGHLWKKGPYFDPFDFYSIDSDIAPKKIEADDFSTNRDIPTGSWDAFRINRLDRTPVRDEHLGSLRGYSSSNASQLVPRLSVLGAWIAKVSDQPAAVWWAAQQISLHPSLQQHITWNLNRKDSKIPVEMRNCWRFLFEVWSRPKDDLSRDWYELRSEIAKEGWNSSVVRRFGKVFRPHLVADVAYWGGPKPPSASDLSFAEQILQRDVKYPEAHEEIEIPKEWRIEVMGLLRQNLELAVSLEKEIGGYGLDNLSPIRPDETPGIDGFDRTHGLSAAMLQFSAQFSLLMDEDVDAARREFLYWSPHDESVFASLRIWAAGFEGIVSAHKFAGLIIRLSDRVFWDQRHQRDLLLVLADRWGHLSIRSRKLIENRLLKGRKRWKQEKLAAFKTRSAWSILDRVHWLADQGCDLSFDVQALSQRLRVLAPDWKPEYATKASESLESRSGWVKTDDSHDALTGAPLSSLLAIAKGKTGRSREFLVETDPFGGFVKKYPVRALAALRLAVKSGDFHEWAWESFLSSEARQSDKPRFARLIAERIASLPVPRVATIVRSAAGWFAKATKKVPIDCIDSYDRAAKALTDALHARPKLGRSGIVRGSRSPDWTTEAINSAAGSVAEAMFNDPRKDNLSRGQGLPDDFRRNAERLLSLKGDLRRYVLVLFFHQLNWFYAIDPDWSEDKLLRIFRGRGRDDKDAAWSGFFWNARTPDAALYYRLKDHLLKLAVDPFPSRRSYAEVIAGMILAGWGSKDKATGKSFVSDDEMHDLLITAGDSFRSRVLWQIEHWAGNDKADAADKWAERVPELLKIWPRQLSARSPNTSARLCELAFSNDDRFPEIVDLVLPIVTTIARDHLRLPELRKTGPNLVDRHPEKALALLHAVLPDSAAAWPYGIEGTIERIGKADKKLLTDDRLIALQRRWDAR